MSCRCSHSAQRMVLRQLCDDAAHLIGRVRGPSLGCYSPSLCPPEPAFQTLTAGGNRKLKKFWILLESLELRVCCLPMPQQVGRRADRVLGIFAPGGMMPFV